MDKEQLWQTTLGELEVTLSKVHFTTWFKGTFVVSDEDNLIIIGVPNSFAQEWLKNKYHGQIFEVLKKFRPELTEIKYKICSIAPPNLASQPIDTPINTNKISKDGDKEPIDNTFNLNTNYTFDNFVVGSSNRLAHAASVAVSNKPGKKYNPLFIYGGVGLGKTHLVQAVGNEIKKRNPKAKIVYAPCEHFANDFIDALQNKKIDNFKRKYRDTDVLLIDDIQFLSGKEGTQEEFFHTFNALQQGNRQVILTSDRVPQAIPELAGRLSSRFAGGMVADIKQPDLETRMAILNAKCLEKGINPDKEIINYIAQNISSNIRELEGALNKIKTHSELYNCEANMEMVTQILEPFISTNRNQYITADKIVKIIANFFGIKCDELTGKRRNKELVYPRQICMYLLRHELNYSYPRIGKELGGKDHTTIIHGTEKIEKELSRNDKLQREISMIKEKLYI